MKVGGQQLVRRRLVYQSCEGSVNRMKESVNCVELIKAEQFNELGGSPRIIDLKADIKPTGDTLLGRTECISMKH